MAMLSECCPSKGICVKVRHTSPWLPQVMRWPSSTASGYPRPCGEQSEKTVQMVRVHGGRAGMASSTLRIWPDHVWRRQPATLTARTNEQLPLFAPPQTLDTCQQCGRCRRAGELHWDLRPSLLALCAVSSRALRLVLWRPCSCRSPDDVWPSRYTLRTFVLAQACHTQAKTIFGSFCGALQFGLFEHFAPACSQGNAVTHRCFSRGRCECKRLQSAAWHSKHQSCSSWSLSRGAVTPWRWRAQGGAATDALRFLHLVRRLSLHLILLNL